MSTSNRVREFRKLNSSFLAGVSSVERLALGSLIYSAFPQFYELLPVTTECAYDMLAAQVGLAGTELENTYGMIQTGVVVGILSIVSSRVLPGAMIRSAVNLQKALRPDQALQFRTLLQGFGARVEPVTTDSMYLSRMAVAPETRGTGAGTEMMSRYIQISHGSNLSLHVHRDNDTVIRLHSKLGFKFHSEKPFEFRVMVRSA